MTQEQKQLLLVDLCARLPYGVKVKYYRNNCDGTLNTVNFKFETVWITADNGSNDSLDFESIGKGVWQLKPYLRPMSSMTEEENNEYLAVCTQMVNNCEFLCYQKTPHLPIDWLSAHHFDYRGLIENGLALEAPEGMYE